MGQPSSKDEMTVRHQFDRLCQMALKGEAVNYYKHMDYRRKHEVTFSELSEKELSKLFTMDEYGTCLLYTSPSPRDLSTSRMPSSA